MDYRKIIVSTDSGCDLNKETLEEKHISFIKMKYYDDNNIYESNLIDSETVEFYNKMRNGVVFKTTSVNVNEAYDYLKELASYGKPIIHIAMGSAISGTYNNFMQAKNMLLSENDKLEIYVMDSLGASISYGILVLEACRLIDDGMEFKDVIKYLEEYKKGVTPFFTTPTLVYLKRGGRVSNASFFIGNLLSIKPILKLDKPGRLVIANKINGIFRAYKRIALMIKEKVVDACNQYLYIGHGDCLEKAKEFAREILQMVKFKGVKYFFIGPTIGSHSGPELISAFFHGVERC